MGEVYLSKCIVSTDRTHLTGVVAILHLLQYNLEVKNTLTPPHEFGLSQLSSIGNTTTSTLTTVAPAEDTTIVFFERGECSLTESEMVALEQWVRQWNTPNRNCWRLYLGGADETSRANRLRRLSVLMSVLEHLGVPRKWIQTDGEWLRPSRMGIIDDLPADTIWLQVREFHAPHVMPASEFGRPHKY
jgi:hypothetical protein